MRRWLGETAGGLPGAFWLLWTGTVINRLANVTMLYLEMSLVFKYGFSIAFAGAVLGLHGLGSALGSMVGGSLADRWGRRPVLLLGHFGAAAMSAALALFTQEYAIAALAAGFGFVLGLSRPAFSAMVIDVVSERDRLRAFSLNYWAINVGFSVAAISAGLLAEAPRAVPFLLNAAALAIVGVLLTLRAPESRPALSPGAAGAVGGLRDVFTDRVFMGYVTLNAAFWVIIESSKLLPITMQQDGLAAAAYGPVIAVNGVLIVAAQLFVPRIVGNRPHSRVLAMAAVITGIGFGANLFVDGAVFYALTVGVWTLGEMAAVPASAALAAGLSPATMRGRYQGVASLGHGAATFSAPILAGVTLQYGGQPALWLGLLALGLVIAVAQWGAGPTRDRRIAELRAVEAAAPAPAREPATA